MIRLWDGALSALATLITAAIIGIPLWAAFAAVSQNLVPIWVWVPMGLLAGVGILMMGAFGRKAMRGVHPLRERRR